MKKMLEWIEEIDRGILVAVNGSHTEFWDQVMWFASGKYTWLPFYLFLVVLVIYHYRRNGVVMVLLVALLILLADQLASGLLKPWVERLRPSHEPGLSDLLHIVNDYRGGRYGFVSSHAANVFSLAFYFYFTARDKIRWLPYVLFPWALFVAFSRVYLGVHYPTDILVPFIFSIIIAWLISRIYFLVIERLNKKPVTSDNISKEDK